MWSEGLQRKLFTPSVSPPHILHFMCLLFQLDLSSHSSKQKADDLCVFNMQILCKSVCIHANNIKKAVPVDELTQSLSSCSLFWDTLWKKHTLPSPWFTASFYCPDASNAFSGNSRACMYVQSLNNGNRPCVPKETIDYCVHEPGWRPKWVLMVPTITDDNSRITSVWLFKGKHHALKRCMQCYRIFQNFTD